MNAISSDKRLIKVFMNSQDPNDREARTYLSAIQKYLLFVDLSKSPLTPRQWAGILEDLGVHPSEIVVPNHKLLQNADGSQVDLSMPDWLNLLAVSPDVVMGTIVVEGNDTLYFKSPKELIAFVVGKPDSKNNTRE